MSDHSDYIAIRFDVRLVGVALVGLVASFLVVYIVPQARVPVIVVWMGIIAAAWWWRVREFEGAREDDQ